MKRIALYLTLVILLLPVSVPALTDQEYGEKMMDIAKEHDPSKRFALIQILLNIADESERFYILPLATKSAFEAKNYAIAESYSKELLQLASKYQNNWNYGNAIHDGNMILGRLALNSGNIELAGEYLVKAGGTPGSPQLNSFGPNMNLAKDLSDIGEKGTVIKYFELCKKFWKLEDGRLDSWIASLRGGGKPYYDSNTLY